MANIKDQLIRLGSEQPELRDNIRPILDYITKTANTSWKKGDGILFRQDKGGQWREGEVVGVARRVGDLHITVRSQTGEEHVFVVKGNGKAVKNGNEQWRIKPV